MRSLYSWLIICSACTIPTQAVPATVQINGNNTTGLLVLNAQNVPQNVSNSPPDFECEVYGQDQGTPLNPLAMWANAVNAMYEVSGTDLEHAWLDQTFSLSAYDVDVILTASGDTPEAEPNLQTRFVVWTIQNVMFNVWHLRLWQNVAGLPKWRGKDVGIVRFWKKGQDVAGSTAAANSTGFLALSTGENLTLANSSSVAAGDLEFIYSFEGSTMNSNNIFLATLEGMAQAAEGGLGNRCAEFWVHGFSVVTFTLTSKKDRSGNPLLQYGHVRMALQKTVFHMITYRRFGEMGLVIRLDGQEIAEGGWRKWTPSTAVSGASERER